MENEAFKIKNSRNEKKYPKNNVIYYLIIVIFILFISLIFCIIYIYIYHIKKNMQNNNFKVNNLNTKLSNKNNEFSLPEKNCPKTLFVKRNNYDNNKKKFEEIDTNLNISSITFFTKTKEGFREKKLKKIRIKIKRRYGYS